MIITAYQGYELEKEKSNTSEDFFNRSEVTFVEDGKERTLRVLYVRYFDEIFHEFTPYKQDPIISQEGYQIYFKDIVALVCLLKKSDLCSRKRLYIHSKNEFASYFQDINFEKLPEVLLAVKQGKEFELRSPLEFIMQSH